MARRWFGVLVGCGALAVGLLVPVTAPATAVAPVTARGVITDTSGQPLAGKKVRVVTYTAFGDEWIGQGRTGPRGRYEISFMAEDVNAFGSGAWIEVQIPGYYRDRHEIGFLPGRTYTVDFELESLPLLSGTVVDETGEPIEAANVIAVNTAPGGDCARTEDDGDRLYCFTYDIGTFSRPGQIYTAADGSFSVPVEFGTEFALRVSQGGFRTMMVYDVVPGTPVEVDMVPGALNSPVVVTGTVTDENGAPSAGTPVALVDPEVNVETEDFDVYSEGVTDAEGRYELTFGAFGVQNPELGVDVIVNPYGGGPTSVRPVGDAPVGAHYLPGETYVVDVPMGPPATLTGTVVGPSGDPARDSDFRATVGLGWDVVDVDAEGEFEMSLGPGEVLLSDFVFTGFTTPRLSFVETVVLDPGETLDVDLALTEIPAPVEEGPPAPDVTAPAPPQRPSARPTGPHRATVRYVPAYSGGLRVRGYQAECVGPRVRARRATVVEGRIVVRRLAAAHRYWCHVRAENRRGWSTWSRWTDPIRTPR